MMKENFLYTVLRSSWQEHECPGRVLAAVSGGADSMALLELLLMLRASENVELLVAHVDHGLRPDSAQDAAFVQGFCQERGVPCRILPVHVPRGGEEAARDARYEALFQLYREWSADALALAHHERDQAETMLLHLMRGSGMTGLRGMLPWDVRENARIWRPLLTLSPDALRVYLTERNIAWREDATNAQDLYLRNFIRHQLLPRMRERVPRAEQAMGRTAAILREENTFMEEAAEQYRKPRFCTEGPVRFLLLTDWQTLHPAVRRRVLRQCVPFSLEEEMTEQMLTAAAGDKVNLPGRWTAERTRERLFFLPPEKNVFQPAPLKIISGCAETGDGIHTQAVSKEILLSAELRTRMPGDWIQPFGCAYRKSLQDYLVDRHVDRPFRDFVPLLCAGQEVLWAVGVGASEKLRILPGLETALCRYPARLAWEMYFIGNDAGGNQNGYDGENV